MKPLKLFVIVGSTREGRYSDKPAHWILQELKARENVEAELIDLRDWPLPFFDDPLPPSQVNDGNYRSELTRTWAAKIKEADGFIVVTPEYNHGYPAVLKNAFDWISKE